MGTPGLQQQRFENACKYGRGREVKQLMEKPAFNITRKYAEGRTLLWNACEAGHLEVLDALLQEKASREGIYSTINQPNKSGSVPLCSTLEGMPFWAHKNSETPPRRGKPP